MDRVVGHRSLVVFVRFSLILYMNITCLYIIHNSIVNKLMRRSLVVRYKVFCSFLVIILFITKVEKLQTKGISQLQFLHTLPITEIVPYKITYLDVVERPNSKSEIKSQTTTHTALKIIRIGCNIIDTERWKTETSVKRKTEAIAIIY